VAATGEVESVYRQDGDRLWRALYAFAGNEEVASDAVAEAFAQALRRGSAIRDVRSWVWRSAFRLAAGDLKRQSNLSRAPMPEGAFHDVHPDEQLLVALRGHRSSARSSCCITTSTAPCGRLLVAPASTRLPSALI
jgi:DNA-directed RNA polymerase specialized sigma24 family protein